MIPSQPRLSLLPPPPLFLCLLPPPRLPYQPGRGFMSGFSSGLSQRRAEKASQYHFLSGYQLQLSYLCIPLQLLFFQLVFSWFLFFPKSFFSRSRLDSEKALSSSFAFARTEGRCKGIEGLRHQIVATVRLLLPCMLWEIYYAAGFCHEFDVFIKAVCMLRSGIFSEILYYSHLHRFPPPRHACFTPSSRQQRAFSCFQLCFQFLSCYKRGPASCSLSSSSGACDATFTYSSCGVSA